jgi:hypothetical protein
MGWAPRARRTPVCGPLHSDACLRAPAPPPAGSFHCQQVSHVSVREEGVAHTAIQTVQVVKIVQTSTPPKKGKPGNPRAPSLPIAVHILTNAWCNFR